MKIKHIILICSILILVITNAFNTNFFKEPKNIRWKQLTWDDFQGTQLPFTRFSAGISSGIALEYDSILNQYNSYAYSNVISSWKSRSSEVNNYLLNHEQYHFNISEVHSRMLNDYIDRGHSKWKITNVMHELNSMKNEMQTKYDKETDHSLITSMQKRWEYKVDSMLLHYDSLDYYHYDTYSNYKIFFPNKISSEYKGNQSGDGTPERSVQFSYYDMYFVSTSYYVGGYNTGKAFYNYLLEFTKSKNLKVNDIEFDTLGSSFEARLNSYDSTQQEYRVMDLTYKLGYLYQRDVFYPDEDDVTGYIQNANSFLDSFELMSAKRELINECGENKISKTPLKMKKYNKNESLECLVFNNYGDHSFFAKPIILDTGYYLYFDSMTHVDSLIKESFLIHENNIYYTDDQCSDKVFFIENLDIKDSLFIEIGYTLKEDSLKACFEAYYQEVLLHEFDL